MPSETALWIEAIAVTLAKFIAVFCCIAMALIVGAAFWKGRGVESVWPDEAPEPQQADIPSSTVFRDVDALTMVEGRNSAVCASVPHQRNAARESASRI